MSAKPRDLLKSRVKRIGEVLGLNALGAGQANSQLVLWGLGLSVNGTNAPRFDVAAGEVVIAQAVTAIVAVPATIVDPGAVTGAGEFRKVLIEVNAAGVVTQVVGNKAATQALAPLPAGAVGAISIGWIEVPAAFTPNTTNLTAGMLKAMVYSAG